MEFERLRNAWLRVRDELLAERTRDGHWVGELSSSSLSTATAVSALAVVKKASGGRQPPDSDLGFGIWDLIDRGIAWLARHQNDDGGFGDTDKSYSNIATTYLVVAAIHLAGKAEEHRELLARAEKYIEIKGGLAGLKERYGIDKTFVVPIMTNLALAGLAKWGAISPLPFELAVVPQSWYRFVGMPVVSYAIPALVAIGQAHYHHKKPWNPLTRLVRWLSITRSLKVLRRMQPESGGYLEATPLTSFVVMSLASLKCSPLAPLAESGSRSEPPTLADEVIKDGVKFLVNSVRPDGSWPIDTNLATWVTTLSINALAAGGEDVAALLGEKCLDWLLACQHTKRHPFTGADPGGWGWSNLSGAVPDADDTAGALLALDAWRRSPTCNVAHLLRSIDAAALGLRWLLRLQNRDHGWPTFCRGWGRLPFDRSGSDLTAHVTRAFVAWMESVPYDEQLDRAFSKHGFIHFRLVRSRALAELKFIKTRQNVDGTWFPLWFGNQDHVTEENPVYGTSKLLLVEPLFADREKARRWLATNQNPDGGWGSGVWNKWAAPNDEVRAAGFSPAVPERQGISERPSPSVHSRNDWTTLTSSVEETALAVEALLPIADHEEYGDAVEKGLEWLVTAVERGDHRNAAPIGFYFAKLWYYEKLYPIIFTASALGRACQQMPTVGRPFQAVPE